MDGGDGTLLVGAAFDRHRHAAEPDRADGALAKVSLHHSCHLRRIGSWPDPPELTNP